MVYGIFKILTGFISQDSGKLGDLETRVSKGRWFWGEVEEDLLDVVEDFLRSPKTTKGFHWGEGNCQFRFMVWVFIQIRLKENKSAWSRNNYLGFK